MVVYEVYPINLNDNFFSIMTHKELGCWGDIIRENPDRYAYVRQHFSNDVCDLKPITYSALWNLLLHSEDKERFDAMGKKSPITLINNLNDLI